MTHGRSTILGHTDHEVRTRFAASLVRFKIISVTIANINPLGAGRRAQAQVLSLQVRARS